MNKTKYQDITALVNIHNSIKVAYAHASHHTLAITPLLKGAVGSAKPNVTEMQYVHLVDHAYALVDLLVTELRIVTFLFHKI